MPFRPRLYTLGLAMILSGLACVSLGDLRDLSSWRFVAAAVLGVFGVVAAIAAGDPPRSQRRSR